MAWGLAGWIFLTSMSCRVGLMPVLLLFMSFTALAVSMFAMCSVTVLSQWARFPGEGRVGMLKIRNEKFGEDRAHPSPKTLKAEARTAATPR